MDILTYIDRVKANYSKQPEPRYNTQQYLQGGRVGFSHGGGNFAAIERKKEKEVLLKKLIEDANKQDKYFSQTSIAEKAGIKTPSHYTETFRTNKLMTATEKMDRVLIDLLADDKPLDDRFVNIIRKRVGGYTPRQTMKFIKETPTFKTIASQGGDFLTRTTNMPNFEGLNLGQQLKRAVDIQIGQPTYIGTSGIKNRFYSSASVAMENARKSWNQNKGKGDVQFFDSKGKPIKWEYGVKLPIQKVSFKYKNKTHKYGDLVDSTYMKKYFPELQETVTNANKFKASKIDNPFIPGEKITVRDLTKEISKRGYKNNPKWGKIDILHGPKGVKGEPFTNLRYNTSDINQMELAFSNSLKAGNLNQAQYDQSIKNLNSPFEGLTGADNEKAIVQRLTTQGEKINKGTFYGFDELKRKNMIEAVGCFKLPKGKAMGGRIGFAGGTDCFNKGVKAINSGKIAKGAQGRNLSKLLNSVLTKSGKGLRAVMKFGIIPEALFLGTENLIRLGMGDTLDEAIKRSTGYFRPGDQTREADTSMLTRLIGPENARTALRVRDYEQSLNNLNSAKVNAEADLAQNMEEFSGESDETIRVRNEQKVKDAEQDLIFKFRPEAERDQAARLELEAADRFGTKSVFKKFKENAKKQDVDDIEQISAPEITQKDLNKRMGDPVYSIDDIANSNVTDEFLNDIRKKYKNPNITKQQIFKEIRKNPDFNKNIFKGLFEEARKNSSNQEQLFGASGKFFGDYISNPQKEGMDRMTKLMKEKGVKGVADMATGGIASLTKTVAPKKGPQSQGQSEGLAYFMKRGKK